MIPPAALLALGWLVSGCAAEAPSVAPPLVPGSSTAPREVNVIARDYVFAPDPVELIPGETVLLHVINGGLESHEAVIGDGAVQDAWEEAEAGASVGLPPGQTAVVSLDPSVGGLRIVVGSGQRVDQVWTVPPAEPSGGLVVGCHIPGHWSKGMVVPIRFVRPGSVL